jgi:poly(A) polymerase
MKELWLAQPRLLQRSGGKPYRMLAHPHFRACYDFFALRAEAGDAPQDVADWWTRFQDVTEDEREEMLLPDDQPKKRRRRRSKRGADKLQENAAQGAAGGPDSAHDNE